MDTGSLSPLLIVKEPRGRVCVGGRKCISVSHDMTECFVRDHVVCCVCFCIAVSVSVCSQVLLCVQGVCARELVHISVYLRAFVCVHTHLSHAHFSVTHTHSVHSHTSSCVSHTRMAQVLGKVHCTCVISLPLAFSLLMIHPCSLLFPHGHFETNPDHDFTHPHDLAVLSRPRSAGHAPLRTCIAKFSYLAKSDANTGYEPKEFDKITSVDDDKMLINDPNHNVSDFSKTTTENIRQFGVLTMFEFSVSHGSHDDFALQIESKESMQPGNRS